MDKTREADAIAKEIYEMIKKVAVKVAKKEINSRGVEMSMDGIVSNVDNDNKVADVNICSYDEVFKGIPNQTGIDLKVGDTVRVFAKSDFLSDLYIGAVVAYR